MKRTERISIGLTKEEKAEIRLAAAAAHLSMSAYMRMKAFRVQHYPNTPTPSWNLPRLNRPPLPPKLQTVKGLLIQELKDVLSQGIEVSFKKYNHKPNDQIINEAGRIALQKIYDDEKDLLREVEIE